MPESLRENRAGMAAAVLLLIVVIVGLAALLKLGPFAEEELSRAELIARGDEACTEAHDRFLDLQPTPVRTADDAVALTDELIEIARDELDTIRDLDGPKSLDDRLRRYLAARERGIERLERGVDAAEDEDAARYETIQAEIAAGQIERRDLAREVGFNECSQPLVSRDQLREDSKPPSGSDPAAPAIVDNPPQ